MVTVGIAIAGPGGGLILEFVGLDHSLGEHPKSVLADLRLASILVPVMGTLTAMAFFWNGGLNEVRADATRAEMEAQKGNAPAS